jgi:hypothetical protein
MKRKKRRKPNLKKPNSLTWRNKADKMWEKVIKQVGCCEHCNRTDRQLHSHHIISRTRLKFRHDPSNGVCLCCQCHAFDTNISPHQDSYGAEKFLAWLKAERNGQWLWYEENKEDKRMPEKTYEQCYNELLEIYEAV